jgi:YgiT-type zinc finger domain-containing protein
MTGKKENVKRCPLCGGELQDGVTTIPFLIGEKVAVIRNVPAEICSDCGEACMKSSVVGNIESILDRLEELHFEMSVIQYEAA